MSISMYPENINLNSGGGMRAKSPEYWQGTLPDGTAVDIISDSGTEKSYITFAADGVLYEYTLNSADHDTAQQLLEDIT